MNIAELQGLALRFTGSDSWQTYAYLFSTAKVTYLGMLSTHCMQPSLWSNAFVYLLYDTMHNNVDNIQWSMHHYVMSLSHCNLNREAMH